MGYGGKSGLFEGDQCLFGCQQQPCQDLLKIQTLQFIDPRIQPCGLNFKILKLAPFYTDLYKFQSETVVVSIVLTKSIHFYTFRL